VRGGAPSEPQHCTADAASSCAACIALVDPAVTVSYDCDTLAYHHSSDNLPHPQPTCHACRRQYTGGFPPDGTSCVWVTGYSKGARRCDARNVSPPAGRCTVERE